MLRFIDLPVAQGGNAAYHHVDAQVEYIIKNLSTQRLSGSRWWQLVTAPPEPKDAFGPPLP